MRKSRDTFLFTEFGTERNEPREYHVVELCNHYNK